jgi:type 1 glutamine amidotransferase
MKDETAMTKKRKAVRALRPVLLSGLLAAALLAVGSAISLGETPAAPAPPVGKKTIVFIPGPPSHGFGSHQHRAGCAFLARLLAENVPAVRAVVCKDGWPKDPSVLAGADALVLFCDGGSLVTGHLAEIGALMKKGVGLACLHYTLDVPKAEPGKRLLDWIGGYYEQGWSVNPTWEADFKKLPDHPIARGVRPFAISDEWYYHMRFRENMEGVTPILSAVPPDGTRKGMDGPHSGNPEVRARLGAAEHVAWARERPDGGRGFGFTGAHTHWNWAQDDLRKLVLNALVWIAKAEVPREGVASKTPTVDELLANQEPGTPADFKPEKIRQMIERFNR